MKTGKYYLFRVDKEFIQDDSLAITPDIYTFIYNTDIIYIKDCSWEKFELYRI